MKNFFVVLSKILIFYFLRIFFSFVKFSSENVYFPFKKLIFGFWFTFKNFIFKKKKWNIFDSRKLNEIKK